MEKFKCDNCDKKFTNSRNYKIHCNKKICLQEKKFMCDICDLKYKYKSSVKDHLINIHKINGDEISNHIIINDDIELNYEKAVCPMCDKEFFSKSNLKKHLKKNCPKNKPETMSGNTTNNIANGNNNTINNITNNNNTTNNITYNLNLHIKPFGEEKLDSQILLHMLNTVNVFNRDEIIQRIIKKKHIDIPENRNVFVNYKFGKIAIVLDKQDMKWKKCEKDDVYNKIRMNVLDDIDDCMYENKKQNILISNQVKKLKSTQDKKVNKKYYEDVNSIFFNNKKILEKSYKSSCDN